MAFRKVKGTIDFYPDEMGIRNRIFASLKNSVESYNYRQVDSSALETMQLLTCKSGEEIAQQIFTLDKRSNEELGLRFELTGPIARMFIEKQKTLPKPVRWYGLSRMWRYERPQKGRDREFYQLSLELFGADTPQSDAEVISAVIKCFTDLGLTAEDIKVKINNRKLLQGLFEAFLSPSQIVPVFSEIDKISKLERGVIEGNLRELGIDDDQIETIFHIILTENIDSLNPVTDNARQGYGELSMLLQLVDTRFVEIDLSTVRGLAYYTGTVFEVFDRKGKFRAIAGGGRYDGMIESFGGEPTPAIGFGLGYSTLRLLLEDRSLLPKADNGIDFFIAPISKTALPYAMKVAEKLRSKFKVEIDLMNRKLAKQFTNANAACAKYVIVIGDDDVSSDILKVKNLATGEEKGCSLDECLHIQSQ